MRHLAKYYEKILRYNALPGAFFYLSGGGKLYFMRQILKNLHFFPQKKFERKMHTGKPEN